MPEASVEKAVVMEGGCVGGGSGTHQNMKDQRDPRDQRDQRDQRGGNNNNNNNSNNNNKRPRDNFSAEEPVYDIKVNRNTAGAVKWDAEGNYLVVTLHKGNFFRWAGTTINSVELMYPEEALYCVEKAQLYVHRDGDKLAKVKSSVFYETVMGKIPQECYLAYSKLRALEYVVRRHKRDIAHELYAFKSEMDAYTYLKAHPEMTVLDAMVSFRVYVTRSGRSKRTLDKGTCGPCDAYVVVTTADHALSSRLMLTLLEEAKGVPVLVAALMPTGYMMLEEFTDADVSLNWENAAQPHPFYLPKPLSMGKEDDEAGTGVDVEADGTGSQCVSEPVSDSIPVPATDRGSGHEAHVSAELHLQTPADAPDDEAEVEVTDAEILMELKNLSR